MTAIEARHRKLNPSLFPLEDMVDESIEFLQKHEPPEGYFVGFSGGKDSIVTLELCRMSGVKHQAFYSVTGIDPPELVRFIRREYPEVIFLRPRRSFFSLVETWFPPVRTKRWCCNEMKKAPSRVSIIKSLTGSPLRQRLMGLRAEESAERAARPRVDRLKNWGWVNNKPIFYWSEWQVWDFIACYSLAYPALYDDKAFGRIGCMFCPYIAGPSDAAQKHISKRKERWPGFYRAFESSCQIWWNNVRTQNPEAMKRYTEKDFAEYMTAYYRGFK